MPVHRRMLLGASVLTLALLLARAAVGASPEPAWIVASALPNGAGPSQLYRVRTTGGAFEQLTTGSRPATLPAFSPEGAHVVFTRLGSGLFVVDVDGTGLRRLTSGGRDSHAAWSPDGTRIAFLRPFRTDWRVYVVPAGGGAARRLPLAPPAGRPSWAPGGKHLFVPTAGDLVAIDARASP